MWLTRRPVSVNTLWYLDGCDLSVISFYHVETAALLLDLRPYLVVAWPTRNNCVRWSAEVGERHSPDRTLSSFLHRSNLYRADAAEKQLLPASHPSVHYEMIIRRCQTEN